MLKTEHRQGHAVIKVVSDVTEELVIELVAHIRRLRDECFHDRVELEIASNGGSVVALGYLLDALDGFRAGGLEVVTRALTSAASAAADLVALGDRREASGSAVLRFHSARTFGVNEVTARTAGTLQGMLDAADDRLMRRLVERGLRAGSPALPPVGEAVGAMHRRGLARRRRAGRPRGGGPAPAMVRRTSWRRLRERVRGCLREPDGAGLRRLYDDLFAFDAPISAALARELGACWTRWSTRAPARPARSLRGRPSASPSGGRRSGRTGTWTGGCCAGTSWSWARPAPARRRPGRCRRPRRRRPRRRSTRTTRSAACWWWTPSGRSARSWTGWRAPAGRPCGRSRPGPGPAARRWTSCAAGVVP